MMTGGTISNCKDNELGTVNLIGSTEMYGYAYFVMSGGSIDGCSSASNGGGVFIGQNGGMTLSGEAKISSCSADYNGGGIWMDSAGTLTLEGGHVTLCSAIFGGGLFYSGTGLTDEGGLASTIFEGNYPENIYSAP